MKKLVLHVVTNFRLGGQRVAALEPLCHVCLVTPEQATFQFLQAVYDAVVICHSVPARKLLPLVKFLTHVNPSLPLVLLRTGRERSSCFAHHRVAADDPGALLATLERVLLPPARIIHRPVAQPAAAKRALSASAA